LRAKQKTAFVGHGFALEDKPVVDSVLDTLQRAGISVMTGEPPEARGISKQIQERISTSDIFIAVMTRRHWIQDKKTWTTSAWVVEEKGYSLGQNPERPVIVLVEAGISIPTDTGGLDGDLEKIVFDSAQFSIAEAKLEEMVRQLVAKTE
jgi:hypothetical protein